MSNVFQKVKNWLKQDNKQPSKPSISEDILNYDGIPRSDPPETRFGQDFEQVMLSSRGGEHVPTLQDNACRTTTIQLYR